MNNVADMTQNSDAESAKSKAQKTMEVEIVRNYFPASGPDKGRKLSVGSVTELNQSEAKKCINAGVAIFPADDLEESED